MTCPECVNTMERGTLRAWSGGETTGTYWGLPGWSFHGRMPKGEKRGSGLLRTDVHEFRCAACHVIAFTYRDREDPS